MTTARDANVHNIALTGTFDDCQDQVKALFNDENFRDEMNLSAVNSINWARIMGQIVYYFAGALALGAPDRPVGFSVPTGNFGNVFAGYAARNMGLPIESLMIASNANDILTRFFETGVMSVSTVQATYSPSMDIQVSSNFERLLFDALDRDGAQVADTLTNFRRTGRFEIEASRLKKLRNLFDAYRLDDAGTLQEIGRLSHATGELIDPHSAIGVAAASQSRAPDRVAMIALATAHPAKFREAVEKATDVLPALPPRVADLFEREERFVTLPNDTEQLRRFIREGCAGAHKDAAEKELSA